ncbi:kinetochore Sim4 complex subunit Fta2 [Aspergillus transmontanensis]|uniref:Kinetochore Sim4 complex subunit Fta2 n=1 Tax=Aspergillus transmontanensis TaxID=1034304 RepID=A0A5N6VEP1_9EURO|nr:kinetochore Sim4 complex subunit Fta2 [Aspergillus transmontanensis]
MDDTMIGRFLPELPWDDPSRKPRGRPMLRRFNYYDNQISYQELLGCGGEGVVYRVYIEGKQYALKIFQTWIYKPDYCRSIGVSKSRWPYITSFSHECRAFARLDSMGENGTWAVKCHGWIKLSDEQFQHIQREWGTKRYSRWAIVKDYIPDRVVLSDIPDIKRKMTIARKAKLFPGDAEPKNYRGSFLVDLGRTKTWPYIEFIG